jgi:hypothetical protein
VEVIFSVDKYEVLFWISIKGTFINYISKMQEGKSENAHVITYFTERFSYSEIQLQFVTKF